MQDAAATPPPTEYPSLTECFLDAVDRYANPRAQMHRGANGWRSISAREMLRRVASLAGSLAQMGVRTGDKVAVFAPNCPAWHVADFAIQGLGAVTVPVYFNESLDRIAYILNDSEARIAITSGEAQARKLAECRARLPRIEQVISAGLPDGVLPEFLRYETLVAAAGDAAIAEYRRRSAEVTGRHLASIIYTSGTTGEPKGVMLSHSNFSSNALEALREYDLNPSDQALSYLPLAHVYERTVDYAYLFHGVSLAYVEHMDTVAEALLEVRPTVMAAVPRFYEKLYTKITETGHRGAGLKRKIFDWAERVAAEAVPWRAYGREAPLALKLRWRLANAAVYSRIRAGVGGHGDRFSSGGAPLDSKIAEFFWSVGLPVYQGYGLTETSPIVAANLPGVNKIGTVGRPIPNVEVRFAEDGELLVKGPCVMQGYYSKPRETEEAFAPGGWLRTGDLGRLDADGFLIITGRKKEMLKTAGGKMVAPELVEKLLGASPLISNAMIVGDGRKFLCALIVPNFPAIEAEAHKHARVLTSHAQVVSDSWVRALLASEIERLTAGLAQYEKPKRFAILERDFSFSGGELTYTLKLRRGVIEQRYRDVIARLYADVEEPRPQPSA